MKVFQVVAGLFLFFGAVAAQEDVTTTLEEVPTAEEDGSGGGGVFQAVGQFLANSINTVPAVGSGAFLTTKSCSEEVRTNKGCKLADGIQGVKGCRKIAGLEVTVCMVNAFGQIIGAKDDTCDECGENSDDEASDCMCSCGDSDDSEDGESESGGGGVLVKHELFKVLGRQVAWTACYSNTVANNVLAARPEFKCNTDCDEAQAAIAAAQATDVQQVTEVEGGNV